VAANGPSFREGEEAEKKRKGSGENGGTPPEKRVKT
jgi:hypothetical protein